ncbi:MAG: zinc-ribbon domain-containing protein [Patescibacteria group bacterium]
MYQPYDYQLECLDRLSAARQAGRRRGLVVMASGLGKTVTTAFDVKKWRAENDGRFLYLCDKNDVLYQAHTTFQEVFGGENEFGYFHGQEKRLEGVAGVFASFQTIVKYLKSIPREEFGYVVVDESHHSHAESYRPVIEHFLPNWKLGITATPDRHDTKDIREIYGQELFSLPLDAAIARGLLTAVDYRLLAGEIHLENAGKIQLKELNRALSSSDNDAEIARIISQTAAEFEEPRILIFTPSLERCEEICQSVPGSLAIHSRLPIKERLVRTELFRQGIVKAAVTVDCFNEGIDIPQANLVVFLRSTESETVFYQQLGRGLRRSQGKSKVVVLDFVANCERLRIVQELWRRVERVSKKRGETRVRNPRENVQGPVPSSLRLNETANEVLDLFERIRDRVVSDIPYLVEEYSEKNAESADRVRLKSTKELLWRCQKCQEEWQESPRRRASGSKCPACEEEGKAEKEEMERATRTKVDLPLKYPSIAAEYLPSNPYLPNEVINGVGELAVWKCQNVSCGEEWTENVPSRIFRSRLGHGCPECFTLSTLNQLSLEHPEIFAEYSKENRLPTEYPRWQCASCSHKWTTSIKRRLEGKICPACSGSTLTKATRLDLVAPELVPELCFPDGAAYININSVRKRLWRCGSCQHKWLASPKERVSARACPKCNATPSLPKSETS